MAEAAPSLAALDDLLSAVPGTVSVWYGRLGEPPAYRRADDAAHYAASMMKLPVLAALYRRADGHAVDLDTPVPVRNSFPSARPGAPAFACARSHDSDGAVWARLGGTATLRWLSSRMIVRSSNLAANVVFHHVGGDAVAEVWRLAGAHRSAVRRGIEDTAAADAGITNVVTAGDLAALLSAIAVGAAVPGRLAQPDSCTAMVETLLAQERVEDLAAGLPPGTRVAHKNGWIRGVRHAAGVVYPPDAPPFVVAVCTTTPLARAGSGDAACRLVARIATAAWSDRHPR